MFEGTFVIGRGFWVFVPICTCIIAGASIAWLRSLGQRRFYQLTSSRMRSGKVVQALLAYGLFVGAYVSYFTWIHDVTSRLVASLALGLVGGLTFLLTFGMIYGLCEYCWRYPDPLPALYRLTEKELNPPPSSLFLNAFWPALVVGWLTLETLERKVFDDFVGIRSTLDTVGYLFPIVMCLISILLGRSHDRVLERYREVIQVREAAAASDAAMVRIDSPTA